MHLRDRGGCHRRTEGGEQLRQGLAEGMGDDGLGLRLCERRHLVLELLEVARQRDADHVGPRCQELTELDVARSKPREREGETIGAGAGRAPFQQARNRECRACRQGQRCRVDQRQDPFARENKSGAGQAGKMAESSDHKRQPECIATTPPLIRR
jgi:hypothetical protein